MQLNPVVPFLLLCLTHHILGAVLTVTTDLYIPLVHDNTLLPADNGVVSIIGEEGGTTTYFFREPQTDVQAIATLIEADRFAGIIISAAPNLLVSWGCDIHGTQADCIAHGIDPQQGGRTVTTVTVTDSLDSVPLLEVLPSNSPLNSPFQSPLPITSSIPILKPLPTRAPIFGRPKGGRQRPRAPFPAPTRIHKARATPL